MVKGGFSLKCRSGKQNSSMFKLISTWEINIEWGRLLTSDSLPLEGSLNYIVIPIDTALYINIAYTNILYKDKKWK